MAILAEAALRALAEQANRTAHEKGWYENPDPVGVRIALMHSEASELLEHYRKGVEHQPCSKVPSITNAEEELADLIIRVLDFSVAEGYDVGRAVVEKMAFNLTRPHKHGGKKF